MGNACIMGRRYPYHDTKNYVFISRIQFYRIKFLCSMFSFLLSEQLCFKMRKVTAYGREGYGDDIPRQGRIVQ